ncbi:MAG TPA: alpha/beta-hydrolase family protein [Actinotalea sp.]|nr:alpha/beta-hydrolase family protein [Actinotalea sp.]
MQWGDAYSRLSPSQRAGIVAASASVPLSLVPLLKPRSATDQGLITGLSSAFNYASTSVLHDAVLSTSAGALRLAGVRVDVRSTAQATIAIDLVALAASLGLEYLLPVREGERMSTAMVRTTARRVSKAALFGLVAGALDAVPNPEGQGGPVARALHSVPAAVATGTALSVGLQLVRRRRAQAHGATFDTKGAPLLRSLGIGALAATGAAAIAAGERGIAKVAGRAVARATGEPGHGPGFGHLASFAAIGGGLYAVGSRVYRSIERSVSVPDAVLADPPASPLVTGGPGSVVEWDALTREPRRHLSTVTSAATITEVMGEPAQDPIRIYIGLTSAPTVAERVDLALAELERTGALDRSLLVLCSPTGTGYLNYAATSTWEYLTRGDCATLTLQYSVRPSPLSLDRVDLGREQNHALWMAVAEALGSRAPADRPRVVIFGESLGAHTSQDPFLHAGTRGLRSLFIERALWLGTPYVSGWSRQTKDTTNGDVRAGEVLRIVGAGDLENLDPAEAEAARYVLLSHQDDGVALFGLELLYRQPEWLGDERPPTVPPQASYSIPITFLQTAIDTKNAMVIVPGEFTSLGHDYREDIARAVRFAYGLKCSDEQLAAVESALRREELERAAAWT